MAEYQSLMQVVTEMEKANKLEEMKLHEEERKHEATKQELQKVMQTLDRKSTEVIQAQEQAGKVQAEKRMQEQTLAEYQKSNSALREQLDGVKQKFEIIAKESASEKERFANALNAVNERYRKSMQLLNQQQTPSSSHQGESMPPPPSQTQAKKDTAALQALQQKLKEKEEECAQSLQELLKLDEYSKALEKSVLEQTAYIQELQKEDDLRVCPNCNASLKRAHDQEATAPMDVEMTE